MMMDSMGQNSLLMTLDWQAALHGRVRWVAVVVCMGGASVSAVPAVPQWQPLNLFHFRREAVDSSGRCTGAQR